MAFFSYMSLQFKVKLAARGAKLVGLILKEDINSSLQYWANANKIIN